MTTDVIDPSLHTSSIPATYTGPGTVVGNTVQSGPSEEDVFGHFTSTGNATQINVGFKPMKIKVVNTTDAITWEWTYGMPAADAVKIVLGGSLAGTLDTGGAFTIADGGSGNFTVTLSATVCGTSKNICFEIEG